MIDTTILSLIGVETSLIEKYEFLGENNNEIILSIKLASSEKDTCPKCGSSLRKIKDYTYKRYKYYGLVTKTITVVFAQKRFICDCGKTKMQHNPFIKRNSGYKVTLNIKKAKIFKVWPELKNLCSTSKIVEWEKKKRAKRIKNVLQCPMC